MLAIIDMFIDDCIVIKMIDLNKGGTFWKDISVQEIQDLPRVTIPGYPQEEAININDPETEVIRKIRSWGHVAILAVQRKDNIPVYYGFSVGNLAKIYSEPLQLFADKPFADSFALRIGDSDVTFFIRTNDPDADLTHSSTYPIEDKTIPEDFPLY